MMPQCDPLSPGFFSIVHTLLHLWAANISLNGCLERTDTSFYDVEERTIWWQFLEFCTPFAVHFQKISIHLCPNLFHYG